MNKLKKIFCIHKYIQTFRIGGDSQLTGYKCMKCEKTYLKNNGTLTTTTNYDEAYKRYLWIEEMK